MIKITIQNILLISSELVEGGSEEIILSLAKYLDNTKYNLFVASLYYGVIEQKFIHNKINTIQLTGKNKNEKLISLKKYVNQLNIHYIFCNYLPQGHLIAPDRVKTIEIVHSPYPWLINNPDYIKALDKASAIICVSELVFDYMKKNYTEIEDKLLTIENGIDEDKFKTTVPKTKMKERLKIPADSLIIGNLGRICPEKGIERIIDITRLLSIKYKNLYTIIPGNYNRHPTFFQKIKQKITQYKLSNILFPGFINNVADILQIYDVFIFPSYHKEGLALALVEALKLGLPIVTTNVGMASYDKDMIDGQIGYIVKEYTDKGFANKIGILLDNPELIKSIGQHNRQIFTKKYLARDMVKNYERLLEKLAKK